MNRVCARNLPVVLVVCLSRFAPAQAGGRVDEVQVHGAALEGNILGLTTDRTASVYLPPSYATSERRYPVVYLLHGIQDTRTVWTIPWGPPHAAHPGFATIAELMDRGIASGRLREMIVVMPDADPSCHYTDSPVKGGWGTYIARDLVRFVDGRYRTVPNASGRAILGHSMGGHGAIKIAMTHPGTFSTVYAMNPSLLGWGGDLSLDNPQVVAATRLQRLEDIGSAPFYTQAVVGVGQCFSPDPSALLLTAMPVAVGGDGTPRPGPGYARWLTHMPAAMARAHAGALRALKGLGFDTGREDEFTHIPLTTKAFADSLTALGIAHDFEVYDGDHRNRLWGEQGRLFTKALPLASRHIGTATATATEIAAAQALAPPEPARKAEPVTAGVTEPGTPPGALPTRADAAPTTGAQVRLWEAAKSGDVKAATSALASGADVNGLDFRGASSGRRPLQYAAENDRAEMIRFLVSKGATVEAPNTTGFRALHHAAESGSVAAARVLLELGADPGAKLPSGSTPLRVARQRGKADIVRVLEPVTPR